MEACVARPYAVRLACHMSDVRLTMRFIIREQPYEKVIAAGQFRYYKSGEPNGVIEAWRLTYATSGYRFLRVDLDAREAEFRSSILYHLVLNDSGGLERLTYRAWSAKTQTSGNVLLQDQLLTGTQEQDGRRREESITVDAHTGFWFTSMVGVGLLARYVEDAPDAEPRLVATVMLDVTLEGNGLEHGSPFAFKRTDVQLAAASKETVELMGRPVTVQAFDISWQNQAWKVWMDQHLWPVKIQQAGGLYAIDERYIRYQ